MKRIPLRQGLKQIFIASVAPAIIIARTLKEAEAKAQAFSFRDVGFVGNRVTTGGASSSLLGGLQVYYALSNTADASGGGMTLTNDGITTFAAGKVGNAANFVSALSQFLSRADASPFQMGSATDFTLACWIKFTNASGAQYGPAYGQFFKGYNIRTNSTGLEAYASDGTNEVRVGGVNSFNNGAWRFCLATYARAGNLIFYVDNTSEGTPASLASVGSLNEASGFQIGAVNGAGFYDGAVDECGLWNRVLSSAERACLYNSGNGTTYPFTGLC